MATTAREFMLPAHAFIAFGADAQLVAQALRWVERDIRRNPGGIVPPRLPAMIEAAERVASAGQTTSGHGSSEVPTEPSGASWFQTSTTTDAATALGVTQRQIVGLIQTGRLTARKVGGRHQIDRDSIDQELQRRNTR